MADAILMSGGAGGVTSDDVTASKTQVLQGYKTVTADSDDEVIEGTIKSINTADDNYNINKSSAFGLDGFGRMWVDMPHGNAYYHRYDNKPHTCIDSARLGDATADKVLQGCTFTSKTGIKVEGTIVNRGNGMDAIEFYNAHWESKFVARIEPGYYSQNGQWKPYVAVPYSVLAQVVGMDASKMLQGYNVAGVQGAIPQWTSSSHVASAVNNEGFVWDDDTGANRGRGIVSKIPKGHYIQNADWVFLPSPNIYPQNIVKGVSINGVTGTRDWIETFSPTWVSDSTLNLNVNTTEREVHFPNKLLQYNGLFLKVIVWNARTDGYFKNTNGGICPCVLSVTNWDGGAPFTIKVGSYLFYGSLERQGEGFNDFKLRYFGSSMFNVSLNFLATQGFSHQWAGNYNT